LIGVRDDDLQAPVTGQIPLRTAALQSKSLGTSLSQVSSYATAEKGSDPQYRDMQNSGLCGVFRTPQISLNSPFSNFYRIDVIILPKDYFVKLRGITA
jgi:hypothetical protein